MKTCSLCGGKLDSNMRCTFCGLDNTKNDDMYKHLINNNDCGDGPLTHVHEERTSHRATTSNKTNTYSSAKYTSQRNTAQPRNASKTQKSAKIRLGTIISIIAVIATLLGAVFEIVENLGIDYYGYSYVDEESDYDPYEYVTYDLPEDGMEYSITLEPGIYHVGTHIPEGTYTAEVVQGSYGGVEIQDNQNGIYLFENIGFDDEQMIVEDLRLYQEGFFVVYTGVVIEMTAENVQSTELLITQSTLADSYILTDEAVAGEDFPAGVYNIVYHADNGWNEYGEVKFCVPLEDYEPEYSIFFDGSVGAETYHNVVLLKGTVIEVKDLEEVTLVPCTEIPTISLEEYCEMFY